MYSIFIAYKTILSTLVPNLYICASKSLFSFVFAHKMKIAELKDPLAALVGNLSQEITIKLSSFAARCRNYAMQNAEDPSFKRTLSSEGSTIPRPSAP
jgi:hypothetical protein